MNLTAWGITRLWMRTAVLPSVGSPDHKHSYGVFNKEATSSQLWTQLSGQKEWHVSLGFAKTAQFEDSIDSGDVAYLPLQPSLPHPPVSGMLSPAHPSLLPPFLSFPFPVTLSPSPFLSDSWWHPIASCLSESSVAELLSLGVYTVMLWPL